VEQRGSRVLWDTELRPQQEAGVALDQQLLLRDQQQQQETLEQQQQEEPLGRGPP
jgi:hypothetical protein